jgi:ELP3 family radical SAM enzyme/protein acetyltransferase
MSAGDDVENWDDVEELAGPYQPNMAKVREKLKHIPTLEQLLQEEDPNALSSEQLELAKQLIKELVDVHQPQDEGELMKALGRLRKKYKTDNKKSMLLAGYRLLMAEGTVASNPVLDSYLVSKGTRSQSGVLVITVFTSAYPDGQKFSCKWNCYYCPNEPGQPRSYLLNEPGVRRANRLEFDAYAQFEDRVRSLVQIGHPADKVELLVLGGTWESYPESYRERFIRDLFYAANTMFDVAPRRPPQDLLSEQTINESALKCKIIGVTLETRPDTVDLPMMVKLRQYGCTRVQLGVQHTDESILTVVNRQAFREDTVRALRLLKDSCFKVDIHLMPDLPGATPEVDKQMFDDVLNSEDLQADQWKVYPCQTTPFTVIHKWYEQGKYQPYGDEKLMDVIVYLKKRVHPWIRLNRVIRDIPIEYVLAGIEKANLRQLIEQQMAKAGFKCQCIRCREVKGDKDVVKKLETAVVLERKYTANGGVEHFISVETPDEATLFGFLRLRLTTPEAETPFDELRGCALIRELHVYGHLTSTSGEVRGAKAQHSGIGTRLLLEAERVAAQHGFRKIAVISGVGVRNYYRRKGYQLVDAHRGGFLIKSLDNILGATDEEEDIGAATADPLEEAGKARVVAAFRQKTSHSLIGGARLFLLPASTIAQLLLVLTFGVISVWNVFTSTSGSSSE